MLLRQSPETALAVAILLLAIIAARFQWRWLGWWERPLAKLGRRRGWPILLAPAIPMIVRLALLPMHPIPEPRVHDEFTFLLGADTLMQGRVANPQHPFWMHFQSPHLLATPVYASAFPMAQSAALAIGKVVFGNPWFGVWLSAGFACGAICWMLQQWVPPRWALLGALLAVLKFGIASYWMNSYWGGFMAAAGGALALGALGRLIRSPDAGSGALMGVGLAILANSRPVEGAVFGVGIAIVMFSNWSRNLWRALVPLAAILAITGVAMGYCFARVTGKPWIAPYVMYRQSMTIAPHFVWQSPRPEPMYNNRELRKYYVYQEMREYYFSRRLNVFSDKAQEYWRFYTGPLLTIPLISAVFLRRNRKTRRLLLIGLVFLFALAPQVWHNMHYAAPATGLAVLIAIQGLRAMRASRRNWAVYFVRGLPIAFVTLLLIQIAADTARVGIGATGWRWPAREGLARARFLEQLHRAGGKHLVLVRYEAWTDLGDEWVYNGADIDASPVVWARELDRESNERLMRYYPDRKVWLAEPDWRRMQLYANAPGRPMPFVAIGAPGIEVLKSAAQVRKRVLERASAYDGTSFSCYGWGRIFEQATGVEGPDCARAGE